MFAFTGKDTAKAIGQWGPAVTEALAIGGTAVPIGINAYKHLNKHFKGKILGTKSGAADVVSTTIGTPEKVWNFTTKKFEDVTPPETPAAPLPPPSGAGRFGKNISGKFNDVVNIKSPRSWLNYGMAAFEVGSDVYKGIENKRSAGEIAARSTGDLINLAGGIIGGVVGGALGTLVGPAGTLIGEMAGSLVGSTVTSYFTDKFLNNQYGGSIDRGDSGQDGATNSINPTTQGAIGYPTVHIVIDNPDGKQLAEANLNAAAQLRSNYIHVSIGTKGLSYG
jgi:hypothetical protein